jgi:hypothetical protein
VLNQLKDLKADLSLLCVAKVTGGAPNKLSKMYSLSLSLSLSLFVVLFSKSKVFVFDIAVGIFWGVS